MGPAAPTGHLDEADAQAEGYAVAGEGEHLLAGGGLGDVPCAMGGVDTLLEGDGDADGELLVVARVADGEGHELGLDVGQGATLEALDHQPVALEHAGLDAPRQDDSLEGAAVAVVADVEVGGVGAGEDLGHATAPVGGSGGSSIPAMGGRSSRARTSLRSSQPERIPISCAS
jgi:hypothetical protein